MKIYISVNDKYLLITDELVKDNSDDYLTKTELINNAMDKLEELKMSMELNKQKNGGYLVKKLGVHPDMKIS